ncbi:MAG: hypothetical protein ACKV1O_07435 [Saprospiraceae bacterium]
MTETHKNILSDLVAKGKTAEALEKFLSLELPPKVKSTVQQIKAAYENLKSDRIKGILSIEQENTERNRINNRILELLDSLDADLLLPVIEKSSRNWRKYIVGAVIIIVSIWVVFCQTVKNYSSENAAPDSFSVTIFVHGKKGKDDRILKDQGQVMLGLRTNEMPCSINEKGEATFKEIPPGFKGQKVPIRIEHPQPYRATYPDSLYLLEPNAALYVEVALQGTNRIFGKVMDFNTEQWLDSVRVSIENVATYTDQYGWFELMIPENKQRKFQRVSFYKKGYEINESDSIPVHTQEEILISLIKLIK